MEAFLSKDILDDFNALVGTGLGVSDGLLELPEPLGGFNIDLLLSSLEDFSKDRGILFNITNDSINFVSLDVCLHDSPAFRGELEAVDFEDIADVGEALGSFGNGAVKDFFDSREPLREFSLGGDFSRGKGFIDSKGRGVLFNSLDDFAESLSRLGDSGLDEGFEVVPVFRGEFVAMSLQTRLDLLEAHVSSSSGSSNELGDSSEPSRHKITFNSADDFLHNGVKFLGVTVVKEFISHEAPMLLIGESRVSGSSFQVFTAARGLRLFKSSIGFLEDSGSAFLYSI